MPDGGEWFARFDLLDVHVSGAGKVPTVTIVSRRGVRRVAQWLLLSAAVVSTGVVVMSSRPGDLVALPLVLAALVAVNGIRRRVELRDPMLSGGAVEAALAYGVQGPVNHFRISGARAGALGADLVQLHQLASSDQATPTRQAQLRAIAGPELQPLLRVSPIVEPRGREPLSVEPLLHQDGDPWPLRDQPTPAWENRHRPPLG